MNFTGEFPGIPKVGSSSFIGWLDGDYEFKVKEELFNTMTLFDYDSGDIKIKPVTLFKF